MKRFYSNDDDDKIFEDGYVPYQNDEDNHDEEGEMGEAVAFINGSDVANVMNYEIAQEELKHHIMEKAIEVARGHWLWFFKSPYKKLIDINLTYEWLKAMVEEPESAMNPEPEKEEE